VEVLVVDEPGWVRHAVFWQVYPLGFVDAERERAGPAQVHHRLDRITGWLDYAVRLGASALLLGPVFESGTHGYDTTDHFRIDPRLGDEGDFTELVEQAHRRGLRVLLDGVFNHVGRDFAQFRRALDGGPDAPEGRWFRLDWSGGGEPGYDTFEGHGELVALDHGAPEVADHVTAVMRHWLDAGADGWRLDAAYAVPPAFWAEVLGRVRESHPDAYLLGEVLHGDYAEIVTSCRLHAVTQYELWKAIWSSLNDGNFYELAHALGRHDELLDTFVPMTFVGNHDVTRLASVLDDERHLAAAIVLLCTLGGTPCVYYGDEQGFRGVKEHRAGGDDAIRPAFPPDGREDDLDPAGWWIYHLHQELIGLRRRHPWLHEARAEPVHLANTELVLRLHDGPGAEQPLLTALNLADTPAALTVPQVDTVLAGDAELAPSGEPGSTALTLPPHGWAVLT
jgi:cyclomaltodextrinase / maltogenic alpha-amylase / neopullulanase